MARTKFTFEKRQREIARQQKQKDKAARRAEAKRTKGEIDPDSPSDAAVPAEGNAFPPAAVDETGQGEDTPR